jgi:hypothetical protein
METNELKKIWNILAENKLIDKNLAKDSILQIITKKGNGIINKMKRKSKIDYWLYLAGLIFIPVVTMLVHLNLNHPFPNIRPYIGLAFVEIFFINMFFNTVRNLKFLDISNNTGSIKEALVSVKSRFKVYLKKTYWVSLFFGFGFLIFALIHFLIRLGSIENFTFSTTGFNVFASYLSILLIILILAWPFILKKDYKTRFDGILQDIDQTINELNEE